MTRDTPAPNDPTRDIVGNRPVLYAEKRVALLVDLGSPGIVDPGDVLRYTITVQNSAAIPATGVVLTDAVPANTTYVANSTLLNGLPVGQPDGGVSPLASGINISSSDLTPPLPGPGAGTISPGATAVLQFDLRVNPGTPVGTRDQQPGRGEQRRAAEPADRRRWQSGERAPNRQSSWWVPASSFRSRSRSPWSGAALPSPARSWNTS